MTRLVHQSIIQMKATIILFAYIIPYILPSNLPFFKVISFLKVIDNNYKIQWGKVITIKLFDVISMLLNDIIQLNCSKYPPKWFLKYRFDCIDITISFLLKTPHSEYSLSYLPYYRNLCDREKSHVIEW